MSLASLPHSIPFNIGGLIRPVETKAAGFKALLPNRLPFTLSARVPYPTVEYGTVGWELICRSYKDFQAELLRTNDMNALTFSRELNTYGMASFSLNLDHNLFNETLNDGSTVETLFDFENLWEIRFDGEIVFQVLGSAVTDSQVNDSETKTATVSGAGIAKVLEWAQIFPKGFPNNVVTKLETLVDPFSGNTLDRNIWKNTAYSNSISTTGEGGWFEEQAIIDDLQQEKETLTNDLKNANDGFNDAKENYSDRIKAQPAPTYQELVQIKNAIAKAESAVQKALTALQLNFKKIEEATKRRNFYGAPRVDDISEFLKLNLANAGIVYATSGTYDFESSGISAGVQPAPSSFSGEGQASTIFKVMHDPGNFTDYYVDTRNYARLYTQKLSNKQRLVAEVSSDNVVTTKNWDYDIVTQKFWRIREDSGYIVFETSPDNINWTQRYRSEYNWPTKNVVFQFGLDFQGSAGIGPPLSAYLFGLNMATLPGTETTMQLFRQHLATAQGRGVIPYVKTSFTNTHDSAGRAWVGKLATDLGEGTKLSDALNTLSQIQQADWIMGADFTLHAYQRSKADEQNPPVYFRKSDVVFHESGSQINKERSRNRDGIANSIVGKNSLGQYVYIEDADSIDKFQKREAFISAGTASDLTGLSSILDASLEELKEEKTSWKITVAANQPGRRVFKDYSIGDWIYIENVDTLGKVSTGQWRVVGIAVSITADATQTVELTLQSRRELLIERLKQQVSNLSASSSSGGTNIGSAISAATLIEQATLAGLKDVVIEYPVEGDVLTYSNGFWVPQAPGDKTVPQVPQFLSSYSNVYYPKDGISVRGQVELTWDTPTNTDGSFITDGHHFEIRYKPNITADYAANWLEGESNNWNNLDTWGQPVIPPITNSGWNVAYIGWDEVTTVIQELTPGVEYIFQIRAVDSSTPQHFSSWSDDYLVGVAVDSIAPDKPAPPVIASSYLSIQVTHYLGKATGGTFNLPPDMAYLEVHVGPPAFYPSEDTLVGKIIADQGLIRSGTPVIQTFNIDSTDNIYVRVIAVDQTGNKSAPSNAVTSTINLIDDAHISDLTASKITAGTISSSIILGGVIKTGESGARAEMNFEGFRIFSEDDDETISLLGNPGTTGNFLLIKDLEDPTQTLAGIDGTGRGSFQSVEVVSDLIIEGENLIDDIITPRGKGVVAIGTYEDPVVCGGIASANERGFLEISFIAEESRTYMICAVTEWESTTADDKMTLRLRDAGDQDPKISMPWIQQSISPNVGSAGGNAAAQIIYSGTFTPGLHRILLSFYSGIGVATVNPPGSSGTTENTTIIWVEDVGLPQTDTVIFNDAGVDEYQKPTTPDTKPPAPKPKVTYTKTYSSTWSGTYRSNGDQSASHGSTMVQGDSGADSWLNDARSLCGFNYKQIMADTKGATIKACYITLYASHWYWNDGGTARIGTHNYTAKPSSWSTSRVDEQRVSSSNWPKPGKRKVSLGTSIGNDFKSGAAKGIALGPTNSTKTQYGKFNGNGQANEPVLTIVYVK